MGGSVPAPLDLNRYCYYLIGNSYIGLTISYAPAKDKFDVYFYVQHEQSEGSLAEIYLNPPTSLLTLPAPGYPIDASLNYSNLIKGTNTGLTPGVDHQVRIYRDRSINNTNLFVHAIIIVDKN